jgi:hypothetical protein
VVAVMETHPKFNPVCSEDCLGRTEGQDGRFEASITVTPDAEYKTEHSTGAVGHSLGLYSPSC